VKLGGSLGVAHGRGRCGRRRERVEEAREAVGRGGGETVTVGQGQKRFTRNAQRRSGVTTSRRSGSSPSLCVSTSVRSRR
jgi:hypothetical protein